MTYRQDTQMWDLCSAFLSILCIIFKSFNQARLILGPMVDMVDFFSV